MRTKFFLVFVFFSVAMISQGYYLRKLKKSVYHLRSLSSLLDIPIPIRGLHEIVNNYDVFLLDQFGVLHDGVKPMNGVNEALNYLHSLNKTTIILSNTASRSKIAKKRYAQLGLPSHYTDFITSGEASSQYLHDNYRGKKCTWITWSSYSKDKTLHELEIQAADIRDADFLFLHGTQTVVNSFSEESLNKPTNFFADGDVTHPLIEEIITIGIERKIPAICANMDLTAMAYGQTAYMPGKIMKEYERRGGCVISFGKPMKEFFDFAISKAPSSVLNTSPAKRTRRRIIHVGDSLHHDIAGSILISSSSLSSSQLKGAHATGIDSLLITEHGVHSKVLHLPEDATISHEE